VATTLLQAVILWQVYALSGSTLDLALVGLVGFVAALFSSLVGGAVVDAYDRRAVLLGSQLVALLASLAMLTAIATDQVSLILIYAVVLVTGLASSFEYPARQAILPAIVPRELLARALTVNSAISSLASVSGPAVGGVVIAAGGIGHAYVVHAVLVTVGVLSLLPMHVPPLKSTGRVQAGAIREGISFVFQRPVLLGAMTLDMFAVMFGGAKALLPVYAVDVLHADAVGYGVLSASLEAGTLLMAVILIVVPPPRQTGRVLLLSVAAFGLATVLFGLSTWLPLSVACYALVGMADQVSMVMRQNTIQLNTPDALRGRVTAVSSVFISASNELGAMESGLVATATNAVFAVVSGGFVCLLVVGLVTWFVPALRRYQIQRLGVLAE
jgi:MFS family permease